MAFKLIGWGWYLAICIVLGVMGGLWLDNLLGTVPLFVLIGVILGMVVGFLGLYRMVLPLLDEKRNRP